MAETWEETKTRLYPIVATMFVDMIAKDISQRDPICPVAADAAMRVLFGDTNMEIARGSDGYTAISKTRKACPDVFRVCIRYLASPRTSEQRHALCDPAFRTASLLCNCDKRSRLVQNLHPPWSNKLPRLVDPVPNETPMAHFIRSLLWIMCLVWEELIEHNKSASRLFRKAQRSGNGKRWPASQDDLAPSGLEPAVANVCAWAQHLPDMSVLTLACRMWYCLAAPCSPKVLVSSILLDAFVPIAPRLVETWKKSAHPLDDIVVLGVLARAVKDFPFAALLPALRAAGPQRIAGFMEVWMQLGSAGLDKLMELAVKAGASSSDRDSIKDTQAHFRCCATRLLVAMTLEPANAPNELKELGHVPVNDGDIVLSFERFLFPKGFTPMCANPSCTKTGTTLERKLSVCSGCSCMHYCSRGCQREGWKHPEAPHRTVCADLRQIVDAGVFRPDDDTTPPISERLRAVALEDHRIAEIAEHLKAAYSK